MLVKCVLSVCIILSIAIGPSSSNSDNLALLVSTLRTKNKATCDDELVTLSCPTGTSITIQVAQYGSKIPEGHVCPSNRNGGKAVNAEGCEWPNSMQYSLLQTVVEACQKKQRCKFSTRPKPGLTDPCPSARKYVEVAYKCRPNEFRSQTACEGDVILMSCNPFSRVAIYDAQFGRAPNDPYTQLSTTCPRFTNNIDVVNQICLASHAVETAMQICHGKRRCKISADTKIFGRPCQANTINFLKIVYTCVPFDILSEKYESLQDGDEILDGSAVIGYHDKVGLFDESDKSIERWTDPTLIPPPVYNFPESTENKVSETTEGFERSEITQDSSTDDFTERSSTSIFVYTGAALFILILIIIILMGIRYLIHRRKTTKQEDMYTTDVPNVFDGLSDVDNDVDVSHISGTFYEHPDMILFKDTPGDKGIRAMRPLSSIYPSAGASMYGVDYVQSRELSEHRLSKEVKEEDVVMSPKSLEKFANSQFYYG